MFCIALLTFLLVKIIQPAIAQDYTLDLFSQKDLIKSAINSEQKVNANSLLRNKSSLEAPEAISLSEQGKVLFAAGRLSEAGNIWQQAVQFYEQQGNIIEQARSLNYLSLTYFNLGEWERAQNAINQSLSLLTIITPVDAEITSIIAQSLNTQGNIQLALGQTQTALGTWQKSATNYQSINDITGMLGSQINVAKALQSLGQYRHSRTILEQTLAQLQAQSDASIKSTGLGMLGVALQALGDLNQSKELLEQSLTISQKLEKRSSIVKIDISETLLSLGNTLAALQQTDTALARYQQAADLAPTLLTRIEAQINQLSLLIKTNSKKCLSNNTSCQKNKLAILALVPQIKSELINLSPSRASIYAKINFAASLIQLSAIISDHNSNKTEIAQLVATAVQQARTLQDLRAEAYAVGQLGHLYEDSAQWQEAQKLTEQAIIITQTINAPDITAPLQWQQGRILKQQGKLKEAIAAYSSAVNILKSLRQELVTLTPDLQFSFTESVEPVYRELVALLLQFSPDQTNLRQARELIEALQLAELDNFFREACLKAKPQQIDEIDPKAAVIYPIVLPDRLAVIVAPPKQPLFYYETKLAKTELETVVEQLRLYLNPHFFDEDRLRLSKQLYDWLILPAETQLAQSQVETLVFVLDDALRSLPMAALHDGKQYLIQKYSIALTPGLQLLPKASVPKKLKALTAGLSESRQGFSALPAVENELKQISSEVLASILLNQNFTLDKLKKQINDTLFPVIHLATHGQFSSKAQETFLVAWDGKINVKDLNELLRERDKNLENPLELLVLSACQTATGDKKAALGLAGFAVRSGARSTLATLWQVNDQSTASLMIEFYQQLARNAGISKANALRTAQLELLKKPQYQHPFYWAPFVLVGNWL